MSVIPGPATVDAGELFRVVDIVGVIANGLLGGAVARSRNFDLIGFLVLSITSALGGGMLRDAMLNTGTPVALTDGWYLTSAVAAAVVAYLINFRGLWPRRALIVADVLALGCWSATGAAKGLSAGLDPLPCILLGMVTAVAGGMVRDVLVGQVPAVLGGNHIYATFALVGGLEMVVADRMLTRDAGMLIAILTCLVLGLMARRRQWYLPGPMDPVAFVARSRRAERPAKRVPRRHRSHT